MIPERMREEWTNSKSVCVAHIVEYVNGRRKQTARDVRPAKAKCSMESVALPNAAMRRDFFIVVYAQIFLVRNSNKHSTILNMAIMVNDYRI